MGMGKSEIGRRCEEFRAVGVEEKRVGSFEVSSGMGEDGRFP
jgi:hypothetical protein